MEASGIECVSQDRFRPEYDAPQQVEQRSAFVFSVSDAVYSRTPGTAGAPLKRGSKTLRLRTLGGIPMRELVVLVLFPVLILGSFVVGTLKVKKDEAARNYGRAADRWREARWYVPTALLVVAMIVALSWSRS